MLYGGGPLSRKIGNMLDEVCNLCQMYGSTEIGTVQLLVPLKGNWAHLELNPYENIDMQMSEQHGAYEMVLYQDSVLRNQLYLYHNFPPKKKNGAREIYSYPIPEGLGCGTRR